MKGFLFTCYKIFKTNRGWYTVEPGTQTDDDRTAGGPSGCWNGDGTKYSWDPLVDFTNSLILVPDEVDRPYANGAIRMEVDEDNCKDMSFFIDPYTSTRINKFWIPWCHHSAAVMGTSRWMAVCQNLPLAIKLTFPVPHILWRTKLVRVPFQKRICSWRTPKTKAMLSLLRF